MNFTFIEVFIGDRSHIFKKKEKMQSINKHASFYYVSTTLVAMFIFELPAQLYRHSFSTNEGNIDEQTSSRIEAIIHCSSKCRENIASWIFLSISTSKNRQTIVSFQITIPDRSLNSRIYRARSIESRSIIFLSWSRSF